jgi:pimeloyl-ACP methyl ester carboxylesterase
VRGPAKLVLKAKNLPVAVICAVLLLAGATTAQAAQSLRATEKPTIVLLHGAYAAGSSWSGVTSRLQGDGYNVVASAVPSRGIASDTSYLRGVLATIPGPKVLVGHSYGAALRIGDRLRACPWRICEPSPHHVTQRSPEKLPPAPRS